MAQVYERERQLTREVTSTVEQGLPGVEVLAVELSGPERFTVYIDHSAGVDHALCERVTNLLRGYLDRYTVDVSSPGIERPLRTPAHFRNVVGRKVVVRTENDIRGRKRFRGQVLAVDERTLSLGAAGGEAVLIPYDAIVRGNLVDEGDDTEGRD
ncbi:MAG: ribosome maturation factor RimP [Verrucomicrobiota bacterium]